VVLWWDLRNLDFAGICCDVLQRRDNPALWIMTGKLFKNTQIMRYLKKIVSKKKV
jgi:hypothetical protein